MELSKEKLLGFYRTMVKIRTFELKASELFATGNIPGFVHLYAGEEAVATGVCGALTDKDYITSTHRGHGHLIAKGGRIELMMAELFGKETGYCRGKGGSMHIADVDLGMLGANGIVGAGLPLATGAGFACKYRKTDAVAVCFFGDGASNRGTFHESVNMASIWRLPVVYVCENNLYGISSYQKNAMNIVDVSERAAGYGIPGVTVEGNDVVAVYEAAVEAVGRARRQEGPSLIECKTWRQRGHFEGDPCVYRKPEEQEYWLEKDPLPRLAGRLLELKYATQADLDGIKAEMVEAVDKAVAFAIESAPPSTAAVLTDVFAA